LTLGAQPRVILHRRPQRRRPAGRRRCERWSRHYRRAAPRLHRAWRPREDVQIRSRLARPMVMTRSLPADGEWSGTSSQLGPGRNRSRRKQRRPDTRLLTQDSWRTTTGQASAHPAVLRCSWVAALPWPLAGAS
jgi:hypothetical protein